MKDRKGHTLIELLVVLIIVGILIALIVPAVQRSRESARQAQCIHNQGQLAKAVHLYLTDDPYGRFPGYRAFAADGATVIGWAPQVFKYLGRSDLNPTQATYVEVLVCPSDHGPKTTPRLNYVVNGGQPDVDSPADGIFFDHAKDARVYITKDDFIDGLTNTIMLAENLDATEWNATDETSQCILWPLVAGNEVNHGTGARPSSHHPGGFVAAFADGSVKFMTETEINDDAAVHTDQSIYVAMLTPGGNDVDAITAPVPSDPPAPSEPPEDEYYIPDFGFPELVGYQVQMDGGDFPDIPQPIDFGQELLGNIGEPFLLVPIDCNQYEIWFSDHVSYDGHLVPPNYDEEIHLTRQSDGSIKICVEGHSFTIYYLTIVDPNGVPVPGLINVPPGANRCATSLIPGNVSDNLCPE